MHIYYFTISMYQESEHNFTEFSIQDLTKLQSKYWPGCVLTWSFHWENSACKLIWVITKGNFLKLYD